MLCVGLLACAPGSISPQPAPPEPATCVVPSPLESALRIPFGLYSVPVERFEMLAAAGVTTVGPYYGSPPDTALLDAASAHGLRVLYPVGFENVQVDDDARAELEAQVDAVAEHPAVVGWYVLPEEVRPWVDAEVEYLAWARSVVQSRDPLVRPLLSYQPNHRRRKELVEASESLDIVTRGLYANFVGATHSRAWVREGATTIATAASDAQTPWAVLEMFAQPDATELDRVDAWVRHDVYASLVGGARGVLVFSGWPRKGFDAYETYLDAYLEVASELNGARGLATPLLRGVPSRQVSLRLVDGPPTVAVGGRDVPSVAWAVVEDGDSTWAYVVNSAEVDVGVQIQTRCPPEVVLGPRLDSDVLQLPALGVAVLRAPSL